MKRKTTYDIILFGILMVLLFLPMLQGRFQLIPIKPLHGVTLDAEKPEFNKANYLSGTFSKQEEAYLAEHFGFREPVIRLYNQYLWSCYKKTYAHDVTAGKHGWLFYPQSVSDYYGTELLQWQPSVNAAKHNFDLEVKYIEWTRAILKENGVELLAFMAPEKGALYPEFLPDGERDTTTFNAREYFEKKFIEAGFPCIEMTRWFQRMKDTVDYPLIPQTGAHWVFPAVYAADSLFHYMGALKGIELPQIKVGKLHESDKHGLDNDLEQLLNLSLPINHRYGFCPRAEVSIESDSTKVRPKVLFIGNSYMWNIAFFVPLDEVFDKVEFWYYFSTAYSGDSLKETAPVVSLNFLEKLLEFDYIVWFNTGNQMNKGTMGFSKTALLTLCASDSLVRAYTEHIADTLSYEGNDSTRYQRARNILFNHPELIPELSGSELPALRNKEIPYVRPIEIIRSDSTWMVALEAQAFLRSATIQQMLHAEVDRLKAGKPLYKDQTDEIQFSFQVQEEVRQRIGRIPNNAELLEHIRKDAEKRHKPLDKAIEDAAIWITREKYGLDHCRFIDNPNAVIPIPPDFQLKK